MDYAVFIINVIGIISFAAAGAMIAIDKETDLFGVIFLSLMTCFGGGILRDIMFGYEIGRLRPYFFTGLEMDIIVCIFTALVVFLLAYIFKERYVKEEAAVEKINNILDALGLGVFAAVGTHAYAELGAFVAITAGFISSVGGSLIRDTLLRDIPFILRKRVYAVACILGSSVYYIIYAVIMKDMRSADVVGSIACMTVIFAIRMCATIFRWKLPKAIVFSDIEAKNQKENQAEKVTK